MVPFNPVQQCAARRGWVLSRSVLRSVLVCQASKYRFHRVRWPSHRCASSEVIGRFHVECPQSGIKKASLIHVKTAPRDLSKLALKYSMGVQKQHLKLGQITIDFHILRRVSPGRERRVATVRN